MKNAEEVKYIALLSGGKDSVAMTDLLLKNGYPVDYIIFNDTSIEFDLMYEYIKKLNSYFKRRYNKEIITIKPLVKFKDYVLKKRVRGVRKGKEKGFLSPEMPFCEIRRENKENSFKKWLKQNNISKHIKYVGFAKDERERELKVLKKIIPTQFFRLLIILI